MHLEFIGLPGSGKSTLHNLISGSELNGFKIYGHNESVNFCSLKELRKSDVFKTFIGRIIYHLLRFSSRPVPRNAINQNDAIIKFIAENLELVNTVFNELNIRVEPIEERLFLQRRFIELVTDLHLYAKHRRPDTIFLLDEGFAHRALSIWGRHDELNSESSLGRYLELIPLPDILIWVQVDPNTCINRMESRGYPLLLEAVHDKDAALTHLQKLSELICSKLEQRGCTVISVANESALQDGFDLLKTSLHNTLAENRTLQA